MSTRKKIINDFFNSPKLNRAKWLKKGKTFHAEDIRFLKEIIPEKSNILELGCGSGRFTEYLVKSSKLCVSVDLSAAIFYNVSKNSV